MHKKSTPIAGALLAIAMLALCSCSETNKQPPAATAPAAMNLPPGAIVVSAVEGSATIEAIDRANRTITLRDEAGSTATFKCGPEVRRFDELKVGDRVKAQLIQAVAVVVRKGGSPSLGSQTTVALAPRTARPGVVRTDTVEVTAKVDAVDAARHSVTVTGPLGQQRRLDVAPDVDLSDVKVGDTVVLRYTEGVALTVE